MTTDKSNNSFQTLVLGSGAAGLNAAIQLRRLGQKNVAIISEGLDKGTSINTGSDKQTYYKLSLCDEPDSPQLMAQSYFSGGSMHGDLALVESAGSVRGFMNLVNLGAPFPFDSFGRYIGYKTDHDPFRRATSIGPYTSREMCRVLIAEVQRLNIPVIAPWTVIEILTGTNSEGRKRVRGVFALNPAGELRSFTCETLVFAVGGPGGLYKSSVYPIQQLGGIGLALKAGAKAEGLPESQFGLASVAPRWNVSGSYMQVVPRFVSALTDDSGAIRETPTEFLGEYYSDKGKMYSDIFLKGYQWPFDSRKVPDGSSMIDLYVYRETVERKRKVYLDFTRNPEGFSFDLLTPAAREYLEKSGAIQTTPLARLQKMNPGAVELYRDFGVDLSRQTLEIALCAQHNNGGLAVDTWYRSNIEGLYPVGEVAGTHGVARPGGSALNAGQVGSLRAAQMICHGSPKPEKEPQTSVEVTASESFWINWFEKCAAAANTWRQEREEFQNRMSNFGAAIRQASELKSAVKQAQEQYNRILNSGCRFDNALQFDKANAAENLQLCFAHWIYLNAILFAVESGVGSRGSALICSSVKSANGIGFDKVQEDPQFRKKVLQTVWNQAAERIENRWIDCRPIPDEETWFETDWERFRNGAIFE